MQLWKNVSLKNGKTVFWRFHHCFLLKSLRWTCLFLLFFRIIVSCEHLKVFLHIKIWSSTVFHLFFFFDIFIIFLIYHFHTQVGRWLLLAIGMALENGFMHAAVIFDLSFSLLGGLPLFTMGTTTMGTGFCCGCTIGGAGGLPLLTSLTAMVPEKEGEGEGENDDQGISITGAAGLPLFKTGLTTSSGRSAGKSWAGLPLFLFGVMAAAASNFKSRFREVQGRFCSGRSMLFLFYFSWRSNCFSIICKGEKAKEIRMAILTE